ncbi:MAG: YqzL family protein [Moorellales bacterium]
MKSGLCGYDSNGVSSGERVALVNCREAAWKLFAATGQVNFYLLYKELEKADHGESMAAEAVGGLEMGRDD